MVTRAASHAIHVEQTDVSVCKLINVRRRRRRRVGADTHSVRELFPSICITKYTFNYYICLSFSLSLPSLIPSYSSCHGCDGEGKSPQRSHRASLLRLRHRELLQKRFPFVIYNKDTDCAHYHTYVLYTYYYADAARPGIPLAMKHPTTD